MQRLVDDIRQSIRGNDSRNVWERINEQNEKPKKVRKILKWEINKGN